VRKINWPIWIGLLLSLVAFLSYPFAFMVLDITRDLRWLSLVIFAVAAGFLFVGIRRAFQQGRSRVSKVGAPIVAAFCAGMLALFILGTFVIARRLPASTAAPHVGQKAPDFTLTDTNGMSVSLSEIMTAPYAQHVVPKGTLLIFYRGYW
jgi:hypothetical protein